MSKNKFNEVLDAFSDSFSDIGEVFGDLVDEIKDANAELIDGIKDAFEESFTDKESLDDELEKSETDTGGDL